MRRTIKTPVTLKGIGLHSGAPVSVRLFPYASGLRVRRGGHEFSASWENVRPARLCTLLASPTDPSISLSTVEHLMAGLAVSGVTDLIIEVSGPEVPILDGSAKPILEGLRDAGFEDIQGARPKLIITTPVHYQDGDAVASLLPAPRFRAEFGIDFSHPKIGAQSVAYDPSEDDFFVDFAGARTFCMEDDVRRMKASGLALGGSMKNAVVFGESGVLNPEGLRFADEPVRHKLLDALGDLHLAGAEIVGRFVGHKSGHLMTNMLLRAAFSGDAARLAA